MACTCKLGRDIYLPEQVIIAEPQKKWWPWSLAALAAFLLLKG